MPYLPSLPALRVATFSTFVAAMTAFPVSATLTFEVDFSESAETLLSAEERELIFAGVAFWDDILVGHRDGVDRTFSLDVEAFDQPAANGLVQLGLARPTRPFFSEVVEGATRDDGRFVLTGGGIVQFNVNEDASGGFNFATVVHEIAHTLGFGSTWRLNGLYELDSGEYRGEAGLAAFREEFLGQENAEFVPVELDGGRGTANAHWNEGIGDIAFGDTGIVDAQGRDLGSEVLTGRQAIGEPFFLSNLTLASFEDIGFTVVPEPSTVALSLVGLTLLIRRERRGRA